MGYHYSSLRETNINFIAVKSVKEFALHQGGGQMAGIEINIEL